MRYQAFFISILAILTGHLVQAYTADKDIHRYRLGAIRELGEIFHLTDSFKAENQYCVFIIDGGLRLDMPDFGCHIAGIGNRVPPSEISMEAYQKMTAQEFNELFFLPFYSLFCRSKALIEDIKSLPDSLKRFGVASYLLAELVDNPKEKLAYLEEAIRANPYIEGFYTEKIALLSYISQGLVKNEKEVIQNKEAIAQSFDAIISFVQKKWFYQYEKYEFLLEIDEEEQANDVLTQVIDDLLKQIEEANEDEINLPELRKLLGEFYYTRAWTNEKTHLLDEVYSDLEKAFHYGYIDEQFLIRKKKEYAKASKKNGN